MRCHYCDSDAAYAAESGDLKVGLCEEHLQEFMTQYSDADLAGRIEGFDG